VKPEESFEINLNTRDTEISNTKTDVNDSKSFGFIAAASLYGRSLLLKQIILCSYVYLMSTLHYMEGLYFSSN
jgi:hypothetical protein